MADAEPIPAPAPAAPEASLEDVLPEVEGTIDDSQGTMIEMEGGDLGEELEESSSLSPSLEGRVSLAEPPALETREKHVFVLSNAGKPIFSRHGDEQRLSTVMMHIQAIMSVSHKLGGPSHLEECIRSITAGRRK
jgi:hypothetical protein